MRGEKQGLAMAWMKEHSHSLLPFCNSTYSTQPPIIHWGPGNSNSDPFLDLQGAMHMKQKGCSRPSTFHVLWRERSSLSHRLSCYFHQEERQLLRSSQVKIKAPGTSTNVKPKFPGRNLLVNMQSRLYLLLRRLHFLTGLPGLAFLCLLCK